ncbi:MAG: integrase [Anaerolinea sp.]|jgi:site-specific recombinase XerD|nr:integrase [Anaerolinea sp.]
MDRTSRTSRIVPEDRAGATGLTIGTAIDSYRLSLRADNKSPARIRTYLAALAQFSRFPAERGMPRVLWAIRGEHVESFIVALQDAGQRPATVSVAYRGLQPFFSWALGENEIETSPMEWMRPPIVPEEPPAVLREAELKAIFDACSGSSFEDRHDTAIVRLLLDTGMRRAELAGVKVDEVDLDQQVAIVMGKGRRPRACPFGNKTAQGLDRYLLVRLAHPSANRPELWLAPRGALTYGGILQILRRRGRQAGIERLHSHQFRHTYAHMWLSDGGNEGDLMRLAGWKSRQMLSRYLLRSLSDLKVFAVTRPAALPGSSPRIAYQGLYSLVVDQARRHPP